MRALTWWDHGTESIWSQPWGMAIMGPLRGTRLSLIPAGVVPWSVWLTEHPETQVLDLPGYRKRPFNNDFVIGIALGENAKAYPFTATSEVAIVNDQIGEFPVVVLVNAESKAIHAFIRKTASNDLEFALKDGKLVDQQTGSSWDATRGLAVDGPLRGEVLQRVPYMTAFDWAWENFYPHTEFFEKADIGR